MKNHYSQNVPEMEPSNIVEDLFRKFNDAANDAEIKIVRLPPVDRLDAETTADGLQQVGELLPQLFSFYHRWLFIAWW